MKVDLGNAPDSWGVWFSEDDNQINWERCLNEMAQAGYEGIELGPWGYLPIEYEALKSELNKRNLKLTATTLAGDLLSNKKTMKMITQLDKMAELQLKFKTAKYVVLIDECYTNLFTGELVRNQYLNDNEWEKFIQNILKVRDHAKLNYGLEVIFHPHAETHVESEQQIERLLNDTNVNLCFDTGHHAYSGGNPIVFIEKYHSRIPYLHLKSCDYEVRDQKNKENWSFARAIQEGIMCEPELGVVDFEALKKILKKVNFNGWAIVEQDMYPVPFDKPYPIAKRTREYLFKIGMVS